MKCYFCKTEIEKEEENPELLCGDDPNYEGLVQIHDECALDYFAWLKRRDRSLPERWSETAKKMFDEVDKEYRSEYQTRTD